MSSPVGLAAEAAIAVEEFFRVNGDKRVANLLFMQSPWQNREGFNLIWTVRFFNTFILLLNVWLISKFFSLLNWGYDSIGCAPSDENDLSERSMSLIHISHMFLCSRVIELIDTLLIILRKKNRQITFLHVFHHSFVLLMSWFYFRLAPQGSSAMFPIVNGIVHSIMYTYYILSTFESVKSYLWWKKYVTTIQLIQFIILGLHFLVAALTPGCSYPRILALSGLAIASMFFILFVAFYIETYLQKNKTPISDKAQKLAMRTETNLSDKKPTNLLWSSDTLDLETDKRRAQGYSTKPNGISASYKGADNNGNNNNSDYPNQNQLRNRK